MGNCKSKVKGDIVHTHIPQPAGIDKSVFRFDKDAKQIVYVGEDAQTAEITAISSSQSEEDTTNEGDVSSYVTEKSATIEKSLLGEITEFLEHDEDNSTVFSQSTKGRSSPVVFFNSPHHQDQEDDLIHNRAGRTSGQEKDSSDVGSNRNVISPLAFEVEARHVKKNRRHLYEFPTNSSEDESEQTAYSRDSSTLNGLRHVLSGETDSLGRDPVAYTEQSSLLPRPSSDLKAWGEHTVPSNHARHETSHDTSISQMIMLDDSSHSSLDDIGYGLQKLQEPHKAHENSTSVHNDEYDEAYIPLTKSHSNDESEGYESDDEISKINERPHDKTSGEQSKHFHGHVVKLRSESPSLGRKAELKFDETDGVNPAVRRNSYIPVISSDVLSITNQPRNMEEVEVAGQSKNESTVEDRGLDQGYTERTSLNFKKSSALTQQSFEKDIESDLEVVSISLQSDQVVESSANDISFGDTTIAQTIVSDNDNGLSFDEEDETEVKRDKHNTQVEGEKNSENGALITSRLKLGKTIETDRNKSVSIVATKDAGTDGEYEDLQSKSVESGSEKTETNEGQISFESNRASIKRSTHLFEDIMPSFTISENTKNDGAPDSSNIDSHDFKSAEEEKSKFDKEVVVACNFGSNEPKWDLNEKSVTPFENIPEKEEAGTYSVEDEAIASSSGNTAVKLDINALRSNDNKSVLEDKITSPTEEFVKIDSDDTIDNVVFNKSAWACVSYENEVVEEEGAIVTEDKAVAMPSKKIIEYVETNTLSITTCVSNPVKEKETAIIKGVIAKDIEETGDDEEVTSFDVTETEEEKAFTFSSDKPKDREEVDALSVTSLFLDRVIEKEICAEKEGVEDVPEKIGEHVEIEDREEVDALSVTSLFHDRVIEKEICAEKEGIEDAPEKIGEHVEMDNGPKKTGELDEVNALSVTSLFHDREAETEICAEKEGIEDVPENIYEHVEMDNVPQKNGELEDVNALEDASVHCEAAEETTLTKVEDLVTPKMTPGNEEKKKEEIHLALWDDDDLSLDSHTASPLISPVTISDDKKEYFDSSLLKDISLLRSDEIEKKLAPPSQTKASPSTDERTEKNNRCCDSPSHSQAQVFVRPNTERNDQDDILDDIITRERRSNTGEQKLSNPKRRTSIPRLSQNSPLRVRSPYQGQRKTMIQIPSPIRNLSRTPPRSSRSKVVAVKNKSPTPISSRTPDDQLIKASVRINTDASAGSWGSDQNTPKSLPWDEKGKHDVRDEKSSRSRGVRISRAKSRMSTPNKSVSTPKHMCVTKWDPYLHDVKAGCERCLTLCSQREREDFFKYGRHQRVSRTSGGCNNRCNKYVGERFHESEAVVLCRICFHAVHRKSRTNKKDNTVRSLSAEYL